MMKLRILLPVTALVLTAAAEPVQHDWLMYVGTYTSGASKGIYAYRFQNGTGKITPIGLVAETANPSFLAVHPNHRFLYAVNELDAGSVSAYAINPATGALQLLNRVSTKGAAPCHLALDRTGTWLFAANYGGGSVAAFAVHPDGSLGEATAFFQHSGSSVNPQRQTGPHAHVITVSPDNRHVLVADLGLDQILVYSVDPVKGLAPNPVITKLSPGSGPRHLTFSPNGRILYALNELLSTITVFQYDAANGSLRELQTVKTLPNNFAGESTTAEIEVLSSGRFLYASNRGHDSIAIFGIDSATGTLKALGHVPSKGKTPRSFAIDPSGSFLLAANQDSNDVFAFRIDRNSGALTPTGEKLDVPSPVSIVFVAAASPKLSAADPASPSRGEEIPLWPHAAPGSEGVTAAEVSRPSGNPKYSGWPGNFTITHYPSIYVFLPPKEKATGAAMVVAPGGGHSQLVIDKEGWEFADWLNSNGIAAFVLKYRLARVPGSTYKLTEEVYADSARSIRFVRSHAKEWGVDPGRIGFSGFSAGGEVAGMIGTKFDAGKADAADPIERFSSRPDFDVLIYPFYRPGANHPESEPLFPIPADAPPMFMVCADDDRSHVEPTVKFYLELEAKKIPAEMHIYASGGHGFGLRPTAKPGPVMGWPDRLKEWLAERGISQ